MLIAKFSKDYKRTKNFDQILNILLNRDLKYSLNNLIRWSQRKMLAVSNNYWNAIEGPI